MPTKNTQRVKQEIVIVIDKSGSMAGSRDDVIGGFNTYITDLQKDESIDAKLTLIMFDTSIHKLYSGKEMKNVGLLCTQTYCPSGSTALNDAVMAGIEDVETRLSKSKAKNKPQVMIIVFTDGEENASTLHRDKDLIKQRRSDKETDGWAFIFMGADMDAWSGASSYGISQTNTVAFGKQAIGASAAYLSNRTRKAATMYASNSMGLMSNESYAASMSSLMTLDADDLANDKEAVTLRETLDSSQASSQQHIQPNNININGILAGNSQPAQWLPSTPLNPLYANLLQKTKAVIKDDNTK